MESTPFTKPRLRDLGITIGRLPPGPTNSIVDVPGVLVGQFTLIRDQPSTVRTGATVIYPRQDVHVDAAFAGYHRFNGIGEMTGVHFIDETGMLVAPVLLTNTNQVGLAHQSISRYGARKLGGFAYKLPVVAETWDGWLNDIDSYSLQEEHFVTALENAGAGPVLEGNHGGGTGMICYEFKGGTGTASRSIELMDQSYHVGVLVQANHGDRRDLWVNGKSVGERIPASVVPLPWDATPISSSILVIAATDAPLLPHHCQRLAQRCSIGLARTGGYGLATSGDLFLAFSTGVHLTRGGTLLKVEVLPEFSLDPLVFAVVEAVEEAILNALVAAETMTGYQGHKAYALPHELLVQAASS